MNQRRQQLHIQKKESIALSVEILLLLAVAYNFAAWGSYNTLPARLLGLFSCIYALNNWLTTRSSFDFYNASLFFSDVLIVFMSMNIPDSLKHAFLPWGYDPIFWLYIGGMELVDVFWDIQIIRTSPSPSGKSELKVWAIATVIATCACFALYGYLSLSANIFAGQLFSYFLAFVLFVMTVKWNWDRYIKAQIEKQSFLT